MVRAQGGIVGWTATTEQVVIGLKPPLPRRNRLE
jgi:hypothetical protein